MKSSEERLKRKPAEPVGPPPKHSKPAPSELPTEVKTEEINENEVWWEKDPELDGLWWYWKKGYGWGRWLEKSVASLQAFKTFKFCGYFYFERDTFVFFEQMHFQEDTKKFGGWQNKTAALVHMQQSGRQELLNKNLEMLSSHHSLQKLLNKIDCKVKDKGDKVYKQYI